MSVIGSYKWAGLVFVGAVAVAAYASNNAGFYDRVTGAVTETAHSLALAGAMMGSGEEDAFHKTEFDRIEPASVVTHVEVIGGGGAQRIVLLDPEGREVYTHDPVNNATIIAKDTIIPSITVRDTPDAVAELRVIAAAPAVEAPVELRSALNYDGPSSELFFLDELGQPREL